MFFFGASVQLAKISSKPYGSLQNAMLQMRKGLDILDTDFRF